MGVAKAFVSMERLDIYQSLWNSQVKISVQLRV